jgi:hypothetical protein
MIDELVEIWKELIAQAVSRRNPFSAARVRARFKSDGIYGGQSGTGAGFLRVLRFPLPGLIKTTAPHSSSIVRGWYNKPNSGRSTKWTQVSPHEDKNSNADIMVKVSLHFLGKNEENHETSVKTGCVLAKIRMKHLLKQSGVILKFS